MNPPISSASPYQHSNTPLSSNEKSCILYRWACNLSQLVIRRICEIIIYSLTNLFLIVGTRTRKGSTFPKNSNWVGSCRCMSFRQNSDTRVLERVLRERLSSMIPASLQPRLLHLSHYPEAVGNPAGRKMHQTIRIKYYCPILSSSCYETVRSCTACSKDCIRLQKNSTPMKLFPPSVPLEFISM